MSLESVLHLEVHKASESAKGTQRSRGVSRVFLGLATNNPIMNYRDFLAAMSSSRSDVVTQCVRPFVCSFVRPFFSF